MTHRALKVTRGPANRDPMFAPQWVGAMDVLATPGLDAHATYVALSRHRCATPVSDAS